MDVSYASAMEQIQSLYPGMLSNDLDGAACPADPAAAAGHSDKPSVAAAASPMEENSSQWGDMAYSSSPPTPAYASSHPTPAYVAGAAKQGKNSGLGFVNHYGAGYYGAGPHDVSGYYGGGYYGGAGGDWTGGGKQVRSNHLMQHQVNVKSTSTLQQLIPGSTIYYST